MKRRLLLAAGGRSSVAAIVTSCLLFLPSTNVRANEYEPGAPASASEFVRGALDASETEVRAGKLAQTKAQNVAVRELGEAMIEDHRQVQEKLKDLAKEYGLDSKVSLQPRHEAEIAKLQNASNAEFDRVFLDHVIRDHKRDLAMLENSAEKFKDNAKLSALIKEQTPIVRKHLENAESIELDQAPASAAKEAVDKEFLGLPTSKTDGTILGLFPAPSRTVEAGSEQRYIAKELADGKVDPNVDNILEADREAVGSPPAGERAASASQSVADKNIPQKVLATLQEQGWSEKNGGLKRISVYEAKVGDKTIHVAEDGQMLKPIGDKD